MIIKFEKSNCPDCIQLNNLIKNFSFDKVYNIGTSQGFEKALEYKIQKLPAVVIGDKNNYTILFDFEVIKRALNI